VIGRLIDTTDAKIEQALSQRIKDQKLLAWISIGIQFILITTTLFGLEKFISLKFVREMQSNTPGLLFAGIFFGSQSNLFSNISKLL
jgi:hypothetical protein